MIGKAAMAFLTGQSWHLVKSWYTGLNKNKDNDQSLVSPVAQAPKYCTHVYVLIKFCKGLKEFLLAKDCKKKSKTERSTAVHL